MRRSLPLALAAAALATTTVPPASANTLAFMLDECAGLARQFHGEPAARTDMRDQGRRTDGTHVIGGDIFLEARKAYVSCAFAGDGTTLTGFSVDGRDELASVQGDPASGNEEERAAIEGCRSRIADAGAGPAAGIALLSSSFSQAGTLATFRDARGETWECLGYANGAVGDLRVVQDGTGAGGAPAAETVSGVRQVRFPAGGSGTERRHALLPGESVVYRLGARDGQEMYFRLAADGQGLSYRIFNPDDSVLQEMTSPDREYRGQLWQSGKYGVEVVNRSNERRSYDAIFGIR